MGNLLNAIIAILILIIVSAVCSTYFYKKGQESGWELAKQLIPIEKGEIYLAVEKSDANGVKFLTVQKIYEAVIDNAHNSRKLRLKLDLALEAMNQKEYNEKYRNNEKQTK